MKNSNVRISHIVLGVFLTLFLIVIAFYSLITYLSKSISKMFSDSTWTDDFLNEDGNYIGI